MKEPAVLAALLTVSLLTGPTPGCAYLVRQAGPVRAEPAADAAVVDHLGKGDRALGGCRPHARWLVVVGTRKGKQGYAPAKLLDRLGTLANVMY
ncbi:hypothetical protein ACIBG8_47105 [Nonomuraea sp. NPDC050556]|uniref:hypothetical protein n=1 Tax=Nonomuraea sp. NPDC050556 TaxID=3364369 RepID=UPI00379D6AE5